MSKNVCLIIVEITDIKQGGFMKKLFVGLLSIFMLLGASILTACGQSTPELHVYHNEAEVSGSIPIQIDSADPDSGYILLSAEITGANDGKITASAVGGYEGVISVEKAGTNGNKQFFKVNGLSETENGPAAVVFRGTPGDLTKYVYVDVFSYVNAMTQKTDDTKNQFLIDGQTYTLGEDGIVGQYNTIDENELIKFSPSQKSRRELAWQIKKADGTFDTITSFKVDSSVKNGYVYEEGGKNYITLKAVDTLGAQMAEVLIKLEVLAQIETVEDKIALSWNYDAGQKTFVEKDENNNLLGVEGNPYKLIANISSDDYYTGVAWVGYAGDDLKITPVVSKKMVVGGKVEYVPLARTEEERLAQKEKSLWLENNLVILSAPGDSEYSLFTIKTADAENTNDYKLSFKVGYENYNYYGETKEIYLDVSEKVNKVFVTTKDNFEVSGDRTAEEPVVLYDNYATVENVSREKEGQLFSVELSPNVIDGSNEYTLSLSVPYVAGGITPDGSCPIEIYYRSANAGFARLSLQADGTKWIVGQLGAEDKIVKTKISAAGEIYIKAAANLSNQTTDGLKLVFTSVDNENAITTLALTLKKSPSISDLEKVRGVEIVEEDGKYSVVKDADGNPELIDDVMTGKVIIDSRSQTTVTKAFILEGQRSIDGLYASYNKENVTISNWTILEIGQNAKTGKEYIIFSVDFTLNANAVGKTVSQVYAIAHSNGNKVGGDPLKDTFKIDIILPLDDISVFPDMGNDLSNSITDASYYDGQSNVKFMMLKNNKVTPIFFAIKQVNGFTAKIDKFSVRYLSIEDYLKTGASEEDFFALAEDIETLTSLDETIFGEGKIATFTANEEMVGGNIVTRNVGYVYIFLSFEGKDENGAKKVVNRVFLVENYNAPEGMNVNPEVDREVEIYSFDSVSDKDQLLTYKNIRIDFDNSNTTYCDETNVTIKSRQYDGRNIYYAVEDTQVSSSGIEFKIVGLTTAGENQINDEVVIIYSIIKNGKKVYEFETSVALTILKAQRVETLVWRNADENGLYYELESDEKDARSRYLVLDSRPTDARNHSMKVVITTDKGKITTDLTPDYNIASGTIAINLKQAVTTGMSGYAYVLPADAVFNGELKYYYRTDKTTSQMIPFENVDLDAGIETEMSKDVNEIASYYEDLIRYGYFKSNDEGGIKIVSFADIILKIQIEVADGSAEHPLRIFNEKQLKVIKPAVHYVVMNDIRVTDWQSIDTLVAGIAGFSGSETITFEGEANQTFVGTIAAGAYVKGLRFVGNVNGKGFVANENNGTIENVVVDTNGNKASTLNSNYQAGGIVGTNNGTIKNVGVYGLSITGNTIVGGVAAENTGSIKEARVEFYNLEVGTDTYETNKFTAASVGGIVGTNSGTIEKAYAYDYTLDVNKQNKALNATNSQPFAVSNTGTIQQVFAVVGLNATTVTPTKLYYLGYYTGNDTDGYNYEIKASEEASGFMQESDEGFDPQVNNNKKYFKDFYQPKAVTKADIDKLCIHEVKDINGYYKSIAVDKTTEGNGILFFYDLKADSADLSSSQLNDLNKLNSISIAQLLGMEKGKEGVVVTSSNTQIAKVNGTSLQILSAGEITLTVGSKQDANANIKIKVKVINAISKIEIARTDENGRLIVVEENKSVNVLRTKSINFTVYPQTTIVVLGNLADKFEFVSTQYSLNSERSGEAGKMVEVAVEPGKLQITTDSDSENTAITVYPKLFADEYQEAIKKVFKREFEVNPTNGVLSLSISKEQVPLTPALIAEVEVVIETTQAGDYVYPEIRLAQNKQMLTRKEDVAQTNKYVYINGYNERVLTAVRTAGRPKTTDYGSHIYTFTFTFDVHPNYRNQVSDNMEFEVYFDSSSGYSSLPSGKTMKIILERQTFTNVDVTNIKISETVIRNTDEIYTAKLPTSTLAPGNASILKVNVNPEYAYYDYAEITYSGAATPSAVNIEAVRLVDRAKGEYGTLTADVGVAEKVGTKLRFTPADNSITKHSLYFKLWINTTVDRDSEIKITISFFKNGTTSPLTLVNYYLDVTYLTEPRVTIEGQDIAYVAKGSINEVKIEVLEDQKLEDLLISADGMYGISLGSVSKEPTHDPVRGVNVYTAYLTASVKAKTDAKNVFHIYASVSREINGEKETKTSIATGVIVDFKIDAVAIKGALDGQFEAWQGVSKSLEIEYNILPESYVVSSSNESIVNELLAKQAKFKTTNFYPETIETGNTRQTEYYINYTKKDGLWKPVYTADRLYVETAEGPKHWSDETLDLPFVITENQTTKSVSIKGTKANSAPVSMILYTYIYADGIKNEIETRFTVNVSTFSDDDLALPIKSASDFLALNPSDSSTEVTPHDYILENDIVLENYTPFNTTAIRSLDGNGYTIYIKSFDLDSTSALNLALFNTVGAIASTGDSQDERTVIKNVRVNYYNGGQMIIDISRHKEINIAGLAITNEGVITNCEVVSFYATSLAGQSLTDNLAVPCQQHNLTKGFNISFRKGANTSDEAYIAHNSDWNCYIAGFAINNFGSITNSRVGGEEVLVLGQDDNFGASTSNENEKDVNNVKVDNFSIIGQGDISGFVLNNNGTIASSFAKNVDISNRSAATKYYTAGFVGINNTTGRVITSYIEGVKTPDAEETASRRYANMGSSIKSEMGYIAGFTYKNQGEIKDSYSNILISNSADTTKVYLASGFVYENEGYLENCYSASQVANANYSQMNFSGVDKDGALKTYVGEYENCYFYSVDLYAVGEQETEDNTTETQYNTGAVLIKDPQSGSSFYGFAVAENTTGIHKDGVWAVDRLYGIKLIEPDYITYSHRYKTLTDSTYEGPSISEEYEDENGNIVSRSYILPYATLVAAGGARRIDTSLGGDYNPIIISNAQEWQEISGLTTSSYVKQHVSDAEISGVYRLVKDINMSELTSDLLSIGKNFTGALYGNGFEIKGISISQASEEGADIIAATNLGLFAMISQKSYQQENTKITSPAIVSNLDLNIVQVIAGDVSAVGGLAGIARDATIVNVDMTFEKDAMIEGLHYVGGLVGFAYGNNKIKNINITNPNVVADTRTEGNEGVNHYIEDMSVFRAAVRRNIAAQLTTNSENYSYAGAVAGYVDNYSSSDLSTFSYNKDSNIFDINNIRVQGVVIVKGQVVGGLFGLTGPTTDINDAGLIINKTGETPSRLASTRYFAGGVVGQSFGKLTRIFAEHEETVQVQIEENMGRYYSSLGNVERGVLDLFDTTKTDSKNSQVAIGGLVGYVGSGMIYISYSKINATAMSAQYSGGLIGYVDVEKQSTFAFNTDALYLPNGAGVDIKYLIHEAFATGDVRANKMAGGLIGAIKGEQSQVGLIAVNAVNYITLYNYETESYQSVDSQAYDLTTALNFNSFVGQFITATNAVQRFKTRTILDADSTKHVKRVLLEGSSDVDLYNTYIKFLDGKEAYLNGTFSDSSKRLPTVGRFNYYKFGDTKLYASRFGENFLTKVVSPADAEYPVYALAVQEEKDLDFKEGQEDSCFNIMEIGAAADFESAASGRFITQAAFLNSDVWAFNNWIHPMSDLFPSVKLKEAYNVVYLDVWNAASVFTKMSNSDILVKVRGLKTRDADPNQSSSYANIEIYKTKDNEYFVKQYEEGGGEYTVVQSFTTNFGDRPENRFTPVNGFLGRIMGGVAKQTTQEIKIISYAGSFISSVAEGFGVSDQTFEYQPVQLLDKEAGEYKLDDEIEITSTKGLFVQSAIVGGELKNLRIDVNSKVNLNSSDTAEAEPEFGLVSPHIESTTIDNLSVTDKRDDKDGGAFVNVNIKPTNDLKKANIGVIAGTLLQSSSDEIMDAKGIVVMADDLITVNGSVDYLNLGASFGEIAKLDKDGYQAQELNVEMNFSENTIITVADDVEKRLSIGGFAGVVNGVDNLLVAGSVSSSVKYFLPAKINDLRLGNITGHLAAGTHVNIEGNANISTVIDTDQGDGSDTAANWAYIGGLVGYQDSQLTISGINTMSFNEVRDELTDELEKYTKRDKLVPYRLVSNEDSDLNYETGDDRGNNEADKEFVIGGLVGISRNILNISMPYESKISGYLDLEHNEATRVGSVLGASTAKASSSTTFSIVGQTMSSLNVALSGMDARFGGMVGMFYTDEGSEGKLNIQIGNDRDLLEYVGEVTYTGSDSIGLGGIVGEYRDMGSLDGDEIAISKTSFGGLFKINESTDANVTIGGTIASVSGSHAAKSTVTINKAYNYGNAYVKYTDSFMELSEYIYGGLIGYVAEAGYTIENNYVAMTSHNSRYLDSTNTAHALFGENTPWEYGGGNSASNFYNHGVCLLTDDCATDIGYKTAYAKAGKPDGSTSAVDHARIGYNVSLSSDIDIIGSILDHFNNFGSQLAFEEGHKLNPRLFTEDNTTYYNASDLGDADNGFGGLTYYALCGNVEVSDRSYKLTNTAFIGDAFKITFKNTEASVGALFTNAIGHSFISSLIEEVEIYIDNATRQTYASLANELGGNTQIYAVNVYGSINIHSTGAHTWSSGSSGRYVSGFAQAVRGKVSDSSTDIDMVGRMENPDPTSTSVWTGYSQLIAFVDTSANGQKAFGEDLTKYQPIIENCFSLGSIQTLAGNKIWVFSQNGDGNTKIENCYSATRIDWRDYINLKDNDDAKLRNGNSSDATAAANVEDIYFNAFDNTKSDVRFDTDSLNLVIPEDMVGKNSLQTFNYATKGDLFDARSTEYDANTKVTLEDADKIPKWISHKSLNYFYPRLKYGYLSMSSHMIQGGMIKDCVNVAGHTHSEDETNTTYDCYVENYTYKRAPNGVDSAAVDNSFYILTNPGAMYYSIKGAPSAEFLLKYDFDLDKLGEYTNSEGNKVHWKNTYSLNSVTFKGKLDGQGHTIKGLDTSLFAEIHGSSSDVDEVYVQNLRLTDVKLSAEDGTNVGILARKIYHSTISNITLSGEINFLEEENPENRSGGHIGSLAGLVNHGEINTVTSTTTITIKRDSTLADDVIGGIVGMMQSDSAMKYCSNYGNISYTNLPSDHDVSDDVGDDDYQGSIGGLIGETFDGDVSVLNSYNAASVLNSYVQDPDSELEEGEDSLYGGTTYSQTEYIAGGIVGKVYSNTTIKGCYNAGIIKAGNKHANHTGLTDMGEDIGINYAGGIVAYKAQDMTLEITNCYNEGTVEALAANGTFEVQPWGHCTRSSDSEIVECNEDGHKLTGTPCEGYDKEVVTSLRVIQTSDQNCVAYGIGPEAKNTNTCDVQKADSGMQSVLANGSALEKDTLISTREATIDQLAPKYGDIQDVGGNGYNRLYFESMYFNAAFAGFTSGDTYRAEDSNIFYGIQFRYYRTSESINIEKDSPYMTISSLMNLPLSLVYTADYRMAIMRWARKNTDNDIEEIDNPYIYLSACYREGNYAYFGAAGTITERFTLGLNKKNADGSETTVVDEYIAKMRESESTTFKTNQNTDSDVVAKCRPQVKKDVQTLSIGSQTFYIAEHNSDSTFRSGLNHNIVTVTFDDANKNKATYQISSLTGTKTTESGSQLEANFYATNVNVNKSPTSGGKNAVEITFDIYFDSKYEGYKITPIISASYSAESTINGSNIKFYQISDHEIGLGLDLTGESFENMNLWETNADGYYEATNGENTIKLTYSAKYNDLVYDTKENTLSLTDIAGTAGKTWSIALLSEYNEMKFTSAQSYSYSANIAQTNVNNLTLSDETIVTGGVLGTISSQYGIAVDAAGNAVASTSDSGATWTDVSGNDLTREQLANIKNANAIYIQTSTPYADTKEFVASATEEIVDLSGDITEYPSDFNCEITGTEGENITSEFDANSKQLTISGLTEGNSYTISYSYTVHGLDAIGKVDSNGVVEWYSGGREKYDNSANRILVGSRTGGMIDLNGDELNSDVAGGSDILHTQDVYYHEDAAKIVTQKSDISSGITTTSEVSIGGYTITVEKQPEITTAGISLDESGKIVIDSSSITGSEAGWLVCGDVKIARTTNITCNKTKKITMTGSANTDKVWSLSVGGTQLQAPTYGGFNGSKTWTNQLTLNDSAEVKLDIYATYMAKSDEDIDDMSVVCQYSSDKYYTWDKKGDTISNTYFHSFTANSATYNYIIQEKLLEDMDSILVSIEGKEEETGLSATYQSSSKQITATGLTAGNTYTIYYGKEGDPSLFTILGNAVYLNAAGYTIQEGYIGILKASDDGSITISNTTVSSTFNSGWNVAITNLKPITEDTTDVEYYSKDDSTNTYTFYAKPDKNNSNIAYSTSYESNITTYTLKNTGYNAEGTLIQNEGELIITKSKSEKHNIILTQDISLRKLTGSGILAVNIIGNGYNISYYGDSLYNQMSDGIMQDVSLLGEVQYSEDGSKSFIFSADGAGQAGQLNNITFFGTILMPAMEQGDDALTNVLFDNSNLGTEFGNLILSNFKSYVSFDAGCCMRTIEVYEQFISPEYDKPEGNDKKVIADKANKGNFFAAPLQDNYKYFSPDDLYNTTNVHVIDAYYTNSIYIGPEEKEISLDQENESSEKIYHNYNFAENDFNIKEETNRQYLTVNDFSGIIDSYIPSRVPFAYCSQGATDNGYNTDGKLIGEESAGFLKNAKKWIEGNTFFAGKLIVREKYLVNPGEKWKLREEIADFTYIPPLDASSGCIKRQYSDSKQSGNDFSADMICGVDFDEAYAENGWKNDGKAFVLRSTKEEAYDNFFKNDEKIYMYSRFTIQQGTSQGRQMLTFEKALHPIDSDSTIAAPGGQGFDDYQKLKNYDFMFKFEDKY